MAQGEGVGGEPLHVAVQCNGFRSVRLPVAGWRRRGRVGVNHHTLQCNGYRSVQLPVPTTSKVTGDRTETTGQGGNEPSHAAVQCNGYQSVPVTVRLPVARWRRWIRVGVGGEGEGELSHAAVQCNGYRSVPLPVPPTCEVTGDKMEMTGQGGGRVAGGPSHAAVHVCMEKWGGTGVDCK